MALLHGRVLLHLLPQVRTTINACRTKHRSVSPQDGFNYSTTRLMAKVSQRVML